MHLHDAEGRHHLAVGAEVSLDARHPNLRLGELASELLQRHGFELQLHHVAHHDTLAELEPAQCRHDPQGFEALVQE